VGQLDSLTVLVVEDEWLVRMELTAAFEDERWAVLESASAEDAIDLLRRTPADLLVTDIRLGTGMNGWDLARQARLIVPDIAVIYVSANPPAPGHDVSGSVFIEKPALFGQVVATARRLLA
jgi:two-component system, OmpR family, response regulator